MKKVLLALFIGLASLSATADFVAQQGDDYVLLRDTAGSCPAAIQEKINPDQVGRFKRADVKIQGQTFVACWAEASGYAFLVYEDGDQGAIPLELFKPYLGT
jgi:hypothetical protein